jgi:hypothetical protein
VQDQPSTSVDDKKEPPRPGTIPDDFLWDEQLQAWYPPGEPSTFDAEAWLREFEEARRRGDFAGGGLISRDELLAAGALNVSPGKRKTLSVERESLPLFPDDDASEETPLDEDCEDSAD